MDGLFAPHAAELVAVEPLNDQVRVFTFRHGSALTVAPGQFAEISIPGIGGFPVSACGYVAAGMFQACIRRVGRVTSALFRCQVGAEFGLRGPFGKGFPLDVSTGKSLLLIAGGLGIAPIRALLQCIMERDAQRIDLLYGARQENELLFLPELELLASQKRLRLKLAVEDLEAAGTTKTWWRSGLVTGLVAETVAEVVPDAVVACGPPQMYSALQQSLADAGVPARSVYATLERRMRCGIGACGHCVAGGRYVCSEGPVFSLAELQQMPEALW